MRTNGKITIQMQGETLLNEWGEQEEATESTEVEVPCLIETIADSASGVYVDGLFRACSFVVYLELDSEEFRLLDIPTMTTAVLNRGEERLGEFRILRKEAIKSMGRFKLWL